MDLIRVVNGLNRHSTATLFKYTRTNSLIFLSGDEDDRDVLPTKLKLPLQLWSAHSRPGDVEDQALAALGACLLTSVMSPQSE